MRIVQASKLVDGTNLREIIGLIDKSYSSNSEPDNNLNEDIDTSTPFNKATEQNSEGVEELYKACIESKQTRIVKSKKMTSTTKRL